MKKNLSLSQRQQLKLWAAVESLKSRNTDAIFESGDLKSCVFIGYLDRDPEFLTVDKPVDAELLRKVYTNHNIARYRHKYPVHSTANYTAEQLELSARRRLVLEEDSADTSDLYLALRALIDDELTRRNLSLPS